MKNNGITEYFEEIELEKEYDGYYYSVSEAITIAILGSICGLKNVQQIHQWAAKDRTREFLKEEFGICRIPCCYWLLCLMKIIKTDSLNQCFANWVYSIMPGKADYLLCIKDNHPNLKKDIEDYVQDETLRKTMNTFAKSENGYGRIEKRTAFATKEIDWLEQIKDWKKLCCIGAIHTEITTKSGTSSEWHYYISSKKMTAEELLHHARMEWSVETMHWLLDVHFEEDWCRVEDRNTRQNLNIARKTAINLIKQFKDCSDSKSAISKMMLNCLISENYLLQIVNIIDFCAPLTSILDNFRQIRYNYF